LPIFSVELGIFSADERLFSRLFDSPRKAGKSVLKRLTSFRGHSKLMKKMAAMLQKRHQQSLHFLKIAVG
jgi:hypothetical protein